MQPSVTSTKKVSLRKTEKINLGFACVDTGTGQLLPNSPVQITSWNPVINSGGHDHDDSDRPKGFFVPTIGSTSGSAIWFTSYTSPEVSGVIRAALVCFQPNGLPSPPLIFTIGVRIPDLVALDAEGENFTLVGSFGMTGVNSKHIENHYGVIALHNIISKIANLYAQEFPGEKIDINDMSLIEGGLFDVFNNWRPDHVSHRSGDDVDIRLVDGIRRRKMIAILESESKKTPPLWIHPEFRKRHWHVRIL